MITTGLELQALPEGLGVLADIDGTQSLAELTVAVNDLCAQVERRRETAVAVLRLHAADWHREWPGEVSTQQVNRWERAVRRLEKLSAVSIAVAEGTCGGPALDLLLAVDFRVAGPDLTLVLPVNDGHFWPGMSMFRLVQHIGLSRARQLVLWGTDIPLARAVDLGLIDRVSPDLDDVVFTASVLTGRISDRETAIRRQLLNEAGTASYDEALGIHLAACDRELRRLRRADGEQAEAPAARAAS